MIVNYAEINEAERMRLVALLGRLSEADFARTLQNGWTVAVVLAHVAFWDRYVVAILAEWARDGFFAPISKYNAINDAVEKMSRIIPTGALAAWVRASAELADQAAAAVSPELAAAIEASGKVHYLYRFKHRRHHLDQLEALLGA